jgi:hypothetical protein
MCQANLEFNGQEVSEEQINSLSVKNDGEKSGCGCHEKSDFVKCCGGPCKKS